MVSLRVRAAGLVNPECSEAVGVPPSHGPSEGGVDPRLVQVGERSQRATHNPPRGPAPDVRDCRIRHGGWLLVLCLTMGGTGKLRGRPESRACRCGGGAPLPGSSACPDWPTRSQAEWRLRHARDRCCRCVSVGTSTRRRSAELAVRGHQLSSTEGGHRPSRPGRSQRPRVRSMRTRADRRCQRASYRCELAPYRCELAPYRCELAPYRCELAPYRCELAPYRCELAPYRCELAPYRCELAPYRCELAPYRCGFDADRPGRLGRLGR